jgi:hypothetical protein
MMTVREVADRYGVTTGFMVQALAKVGYNVAGPDSVLPAAALARFESEFGDKIRAKRPAPELASSRESDSAAVPAAARDRRRPKPHVMRVAHSEVTAVRVASGHIEKRLLDDPGFVHAIDTAGTQDGDPWDGEIAPGRVHFYGGSIHSGPRAACGYAHMRAVLGDEFVPADDPTGAGQCSRCAAVVAAGRGSASRRTRSATTARPSATHSCASGSTARSRSKTARCAPSTGASRTATSTGLSGRSAWPTTFLLPTKSAATSLRPEHP